MPRACLSAAEPRGRCRRRRRPWVCLETGALQRVRRRPTLVLVRRSGAAPAPSRSDLSRHRGIPDGSTRARQHCVGFMAVALGPSRARTPTPGPGSCRANRYCTKRRSHRSARTGSDRVQAGTFARLRRAVGERCSTRRRIELIRPARGGDRPFVGRGGKDPDQVEEVAVRASDLSQRLECCLDPRLFVKAPLIGG